LHAFERLAPVQLLLAIEKKPSDGMSSITH